jgi:hypothetical protein
MKQIRLFFTYSFHKKYFISPSITRFLVFELIITLFYSSLWSLVVTDRLKTGGEWEGVPVCCVLSLLHLKVYCTCLLHICRNKL